MTTSATTHKLPDAVSLLNPKALERLSAGDYSAAIDLLRRALNFDPDSAAAHGNLAVALRRAHYPIEAEAHCRRAIILDPHYLPAHKLLAELLRDRDDLPDALACYQRVVALAPTDAMAHNNAGLLLRKLGRVEEAAATFARAAAIDPNDWRIRFNLLMVRGDDAALPDAIEYCRRSLEEHPDRIDVLVNLAVSLQFSGRYEEALTYLEQAIAASPDQVEARFNRALLLLLLGDYPRGWAEYEQRWNLPELKKPRFAQPQWQGENIAGKTILLHAEQGLGDTIQCLRYVGLVATRCSRVVLRIERRLTRTAASLPANVAIVHADARIPPFDVWCPLLSLPRIFGTRVETIPADTPYLGVRPVLAERWRRRLGGLPGRKIGLAWAGSPTHINDCRRSVDPERLAPLFDAAGISWVSLQASPAASSIAGLPVNRILDLSAELTDFAETAGAILNLDLVITVDTAVAHLAGALGRPAWVMLPFSPDWRWLLDRDDSPWYPSLRLFRQPAPGDWDSVVARVTECLAAFR